MKEINEIIIKEFELNIIHQKLMGKTPIVIFYEFDKGIIGGGLILPLPNYKKWKK